MAGMGPIPPPESARKPSGAVGQIGAPEAGRAIADEPAAGAKAAKPAGLSSGMLFPIVRPREEERTYSK